VVTDGGRRRRVQVSVFVKLVAIIFVMTLSQLTMVVWFFFVIVTPDVIGVNRRLVKEFAHAFAASAPNLDTAQRLSGRLNVQMRYEGPDGAWTTRADLPSIEDVRNHQWRYSAAGEDLYLVPGPRGGAYLFAWNVHRRMSDAHDTMLKMLLLSMIAVVIVAYVFLRYLLRPLRGLGDGVARLSEGQLDVVLPNRTRDEFGLLTDAFNRMVRRVREMIHARDQLLLDVSHELRSPLTRLKVALELLPENEKRAQMAADMAEMEVMISELLELERLRDGRGIAIVRQDLLAIVREVADSFRDKPPGVRVITAAREMPLDIDGDKIATVLRNLLENAVKYSLPDSHAVQISMADDERSVVIRVSDDGPGIPDGDASNLFEPFFRVDRSRSKKTGGYGLGLSICKRIVEAHGGTIAVENNHASRGASFILTLPKPA